MLGDGPPLAALDVGDSRVLALLAEVDANGQLVVRGAGVSPMHEGMEAGQVVGFRSVVERIKEAVQEAETTAHVPMERAWVSVSGPHVVGRLTTTALPATTRPQPVTARDLQRLWEAARWQNLPPGHVVLNVLPHHFTLDDQEHLANPEGMVGSRLSMSALVLSCKEGPLRSLEKAINDAGVAVEGFLFAPVAASLAVLTPEEKALGALVVDLGYGTTNFALWHRSHVLATGSIPYGSNNINTDLVHLYGTTFAAAEQIKRSKLTLLVETVDEDEVVLLPTLAGATHKVARQAACQLAASRFVELLQLVSQSYLPQLTRELRLLSVVLCGGGSYLEGADRKASAFFGCPARLGELLAWQDATGCLTQPPFPVRSAACALGLLHYGSQTIQGRLGPMAARWPRRKSAIWDRVMGFWQKWGKKEGANDHL
ncbi:MAG: cell division protein FtsA [Thermoanaerobaculum sp.]|nr:cell division protein FtsA [Thermoanaerobaculum sp.]